MVLLTASRSSARRAPISYTPPVKPPPPSTRAVLSRRGRRRRSNASLRPTPRGAIDRCCRPLALEPPAFFRLGSSLTTLPIANILVLRGPETTCAKMDLDNRDFGQLRDRGGCRAHRERADRPSRSAV